MSNVSNNVLIMQNILDRSTDMVFVADHILKMSWVPMATRKASLILGCHPSALAFRWWR